MVSFLQLSLPCFAIQLKRKMESELSGPNVFSFTPIWNLQASILPNQGAFAQPFLLSVFLHARRYLEVVLAGSSDAHVSRAWAGNAAAAATN